MFKLNRKIQYEVKNQSIQLAQNKSLSLIYGKLDRVLHENDQLKLKSDNILSQLAQINIQTLQKNSQIKVQPDTILENNIILNPENMIKSKLNQLPEKLNFLSPSSFLLDKLKKFEMYKKIPRLHTNVIYKIINYENHKKYITCSKDKTIIVRNSEDNRIITTLSDHKEAVRDILLLSNGKLASSSQDKTIKIWNLTNGTCEQTLIGHSDSVYCLLELKNSILLSCSKDLSIGVWDISRKHKRESQFYQVKNDKQLQALCMILICKNELAVSSFNNINIYSFAVAQKSFKVIKTLKGHDDWVCDVKLMKKSKDLLISCSNDKNCRLWNISQENCLKIFKGHSDIIWSIQIVSEKIFASASAEIIFWNIDSTEGFHSIKPDKSGEMFVSLIKNGSNELVIAGGYDFIGLIKI